MALGKIQTKDDPTQYYKVLAAAKHEIIAGMLEGFNTKEALQRAQSCLPHYIMQDSYQWYLYLFRHLVGKAQIESWAIVKLAINHLVTKINTICTGHSGALVIIMCHYALLRNGFRNQWQSNL
eukprot:399450-Ditylum_brightwellii.AAC.1